MEFAVADDVRIEQFSQQLADLGTWQQRVRLGVNCYTPGAWASWDIAKVLFHEFPKEWWVGKRVLDIGANCGGLTLELIRAGATVHAAEPAEIFRKKIEWWKRMLEVPNDRLVISDKEFFRCDELGEFDMVLFLGLAYHFRHPQLALDFLGNIPSQHYIISTQTYASDKDVMINRSEVVPHFITPGSLAGWHPSRGLMLKMLSWAGFSKPREILHPSVLHDFGEKAQTTTNSAYFAVDRGTPVDVKAETERFI